MDYFFFFILLQGLKIAIAPEQKRMCRMRNNGLKCGTTGEATTSYVVD